MTSHSQESTMEEQARLDAVVEAGTEVLLLAKRHMEMIARALPADRMRPMRLVFLKLDEARLWLGEVAHG